MSFRPNNRMLAGVGRAWIALVSVAGAALGESFTGPGGPAGGSLRIQHAVQPTVYANSYSAFPELSKSLDSLVYGFVPGYGGGDTRQSSGAASISATGHSLMASGLSATNSGYYQRTEASVYWADTVSLAWRGVGPAPTVPGEIIMHFLLKGVFDLDPPNGYYTDIAISSNSSGMVYADHYAIAAGVFNASNLPGYSGNNVSSDRFVQPIESGESVRSAAWDGIVSLGNAGTGTFNYLAGIDAVAAYSHTYSRANVTMQSILLPGGLTPESQGWEIVFGSGMTSPNLLSVPEIDPAGLGSVASLVLGAVSLLERRLRTRSA